MSTVFSSPNLPRDMTAEGLVLWLTSRHSSGNTPTVENLQLDLLTTQTLLARLLEYQLEWQPRFNPEDWQLCYIFGDQDLKVTRG